MVPAYERIKFFEIDYNLLPIEVKERMPRKPGSVCMKYLLPNWQRNRYDLIRKPIGYDPSIIGNNMRAKLENVRNGTSKIELDDYVIARQNRGIRNAVNTKREATDVAETPPKINERVNEFTGISPHK